jgi:hypothetical protein
MFYTVMDIKNDIVDSLFTLIDNTENQKKIKNVIHKFSNPEVSKLKYTLLFVTVIIIFLQCYIIYMLKMLTCVNT